MFFIIISRTIVYTVDMMLCCSDIGEGVGYKHVQAKPHTWQLICAYKVLTFSTYVSLYERKKVIHASTTHDISAGEQDVTRSLIGSWKSTSQSNFM